MGRMKYGTSAPLEEIANAILKTSLVGVTSREAKSDILTPWKEQDRRGREVFVNSGVPDARLRQGMFHRSLNRASPHLNASDGVARPRRAGTGDSLATHVESNRAWGEPE